MKDNHVNEEPTVTLEPFVPEEELEENLLQENPEIHKQDLLRYNIIDTISSSGTKARGLFKHQWDDIISNTEVFDGRADNISQYLTKILNIEKCKHRKKIMRCDNDRT
ncbi:unnamed protein product [Rhizophagus irregularis]|nr:unnamed protein product [Rhizophagus irregularis]CAB5377244.1 unnamed protein product [Rhizophagus irregularis]